MKYWIVTHWDELLFSIGSVLEVLGVYKMANVYLTGILTASIPKVLFTAFFRGGKGKSVIGAARIYKYNKEQVGMTLQGLSFVGVGFVLQALPNFFRLFN